MKFYISGAMSGIPQGNFPAFHKASDALQRAGYDVYSPTEGRDTPDETVSLTEAFRAHLKELLECDAIAVLMGWSTSEGAKVEMAVAVAAGLETYAIYPNRPPAQMLEKLPNVNIITRAEVIHVK
jgi:hypothetical protein